MKLIAFACVILMATAVPLIGVDLDHDGDADILIPAAPVTARPVLAGIDLDHDGDIDILVERPVHPFVETIVEPVAYARGARPIVESFVQAPHHFQRPVETIVQAPHHVQRPAYEPWNVAQSGPGAQVHDEERNYYYSEPVNHGHWNERR